MNDNLEIERSRSDVFWGEIAPCEHMAQFYEDHDILLDSLSGFIGGGLKSGDSAIVIATMEHLSALSKRLEENGLDVAAALSQDRYIPLVAENVLAKFMVNHWPDEELFVSVVTDLLTRAQANGKRVRAFGEMVALLWARGDHEATVRLEHLWHGVCQKLAFSLFCAYPKAGFTGTAIASMNEICAAHSRII